MTDTPVRSPGVVPAPGDDGPVTRPPRPASRTPARESAREWAQAVARTPARDTARAWAQAATRTVTVPAGSTSGSVDGAPRWVSGLLAGLQGALLSLLVVATPALAAYVATSADPANAEIGWPRAVAVGAVLWLMAHGGPVEAAGATFSLVPLGITALSVFAAYASARRSAHPTLSAWGAGIGGHVLAVVAVLLLAGQAGPLGTGPAGVVRLLLGSVLVAAVGIGAGTLRPRRVGELTRPAWSRVPPLVRAGGRAGTMVTATLVGVAALVTSAWVVGGRAATGDVIAGLGVDTFGGVLLALAQVTVAPNLVLWVMAWVAGPGFSVGAGTVYAPAVVVSGPLPALPMLGALPLEGGGGVTWWVPLLVVIAGAMAGWWLHRRLEVTRFWESSAAAGCTALSAGLLAALLSLLAGGSAGPGRLSTVGAPAVVVGLAVAGLTLLGAVLTAVPTDAVLRRTAADGLVALWARVRGRADVDLGVPAADEPAVHEPETRRGRAEAASPADPEPHPTEDADVSPERPARRPAGP